MGGTETRLEEFIQVVGLEVGMELGGDDAFQGFGEEWQVGDGAVVGEVRWVKGGLFEDGGDGGMFVDSGEVTEGQGLVEESCEVREERREAGID